MFERVVATKSQTVPKHATHWSTRCRAAEVGLSQTAASRIWRASGLQPDRWKLSKDPQFIDKVRDVVGVYLDPPERAVLLCVDDKSQIQALDPDRAGPGRHPGPSRPRLRAGRHLEPLRRAEPDHRHGDRQPLSPFEWLRVTGVL
jgi:hypothetical protein